MRLVYLTPSRRAALSSLIALITWSALGCAIPTRVAELDLEIPRSATPVAIRAGLTALEDPGTEQRIQHLLATPEIKGAQRELIAGLADGAIDVAQDPGRRRALESSVNVLISSSLRSAIQELRSAEIGKTVSTAMTDEIGPAFQKTMRENVAPALAELLKNEDFRRELGETARVLGREMVVGATEALAAKKAPEADGSMLSRVSSVAQNGAKLFGSAAWLLIAIIVALIAWIVKLVVQAKRYASAATGPRPQRSVGAKVRGRNRRERYARTPHRGQLCARVRA